MNIVTIDLELRALAFRMQQDAESIEQVAGGATVRSLHLRSYVAQINLIAMEAGEACAGVIDKDMLETILEDDRRGRGQCEVIEVDVEPNSDWACKTSP